MFLFFAATVVAVFAFISIAVWVSVPAQDGQARDRLALLKTVAEQPGENAAKYWRCFAGRTSGGY